MKDKTVRITAKAGQGGRLFGSVTAKEIAQEIKKQYGFDIDKRKIHLDTDIKAFGGYHIEVKLYNGMTKSRLRSENRFHFEVISLKKGW